MSRMHVAVVVAVVLWTALLGPVAGATTLYGACHVTSNYDLTLVGNTLVFQRSGAAPRRVVFGADGALRVDGAPVALDHEGQDRAALFAEGVHALVPQARALAQRAVNVAARSLSAEDGNDARIEAQARQLKSRIAHSDSTRDWHGAAFQDYVQQQELQIGQVLAAPLANQAMQAVMSGDLQKADALRKRAADLTATLRNRVRQRMSVLRPQMAALCTRVRRLALLQAGIRLSGRSKALRLLVVHPATSRPAAQ